MKEELKRLFEVFGWDVKIGEEQKKGSAADIYAEHEKDDLYIIIDDGMVNNFGETCFIYVKTSGSAVGGNKIFEGSFANANEFKYLMKLIGVDRVQLENDMLGNLKNFLDSCTEEEIAEHKEKYFPESTTPKGWISIEDELPAWLGVDVEKGYTSYKVKYDDGRENTSSVSDHNVWYYHAKDQGITHWWNE